MTIFDFNDILNEASKSRGENKEAVRLVGSYNVEVAYANGSTRKKDGSKKNPSVSVKFIVLDGPQVGDETWLNLTLTESSKAIFGRTLLELGVSETFLRSLGTASSEDEMASKLSDIAETLPGARYSVTVGPNPKSPTFDSWLFNSILEAPSAGEVASVAPVTGPPFAPPVQVPLAGTLPGMTTPVGVPGGFIPHLTNG